MMTLVARAVLSCRPGSVCFSVLNVVYAVLIGLALTVIEFLIGGTRLVFSLPAYGLLAVAECFRWCDLRRPKLPANGWCLGASALFFGYILVRALTSPVAYLAWDDDSWCWPPDSLSADGLLLTDPRRRLWLLWVLLALAVVNLFVGAQTIRERRQGYMLFGSSGSNQYAGRASGLYICPDHLAGYLEVVGCLGLSIALWSRSRAWVKLLFGYCPFAAWRG